MGACFSYKGRYATTSKNLRINGVSSSRFGAVRATLITSSGIPMYGCPNMTQNIAQPALVLGDGSELGRFYVSHVTCKAA